MSTAIGHLVIGLLILGVLTLVLSIGFGILVDKAKRVLDDDDD